MSGLLNIFAADILVLKAMFRTERTSRFVIPKDLDLDESEKDIKWIPASEDKKNMMADFKAVASDVKKALEEYKKEHGKEKR